MKFNNTELLFFVPWDNIGKGFFGAHPGENEVAFFSSSSVYHKLFIAFFSTPKSNNIPGVARSLYQ